MSEAMEVGTKLVKLCQQGKGMDAVNTLYGSDVVSIEAQDMDGMPAKMKGLEAVKGKNQWWYDNHEVHAMTATGPFCGHRQDQFCVHFALDVTPKEGGERSQMSEVGLYTVKNGKVAQEEFLYLMG